MGAEILEKWFDPGQYDHRVVTHKAVMYGQLKKHNAQSQVLVQTYLRQIITQKFKVRSSKTYKSDVITERPLGIIS